MTSAAPAFALAAAPGFVIPYPPALASPASGPQLDPDRPSSPHPGDRQTGLFACGFKTINQFSGRMHGGALQRQDDIARFQVGRCRRAVQADFGHQGFRTCRRNCGFILEVETDPLYEGAVAAVKAIASHCKANHQGFLMETGQETPVTVLRVTQDTGLDNVGVGLDTAKLILYGKGNRVDALDVLGKYLRSVHAKDGLFPTSPRQSAVRLRSEQAGWISCA